MSVYGIISEFNPFHNGHRYLFDAARRDGAQAIVCVMSGNAVQRGELSVTDKYRRAQMALLCGADLVLELPYPWCASGAESFARAGVHIVSEFADTLFFGSECADIAELRAAAQICAKDSFAEEYKEKLVGNSGSAQTYFDLLRQKTGREYLSNDILGIEYIKAAMQLGKDMAFSTVKREGGAYLADEVCGGDIQSATAIRKLIQGGKIEEVSRFMPEQSFSVLKQAVSDGAVSDQGRIENAIKLFFRLSNPEDLAEIAELDAGLAARICNEARECPGELIEALKTKRYTDARLRRALLSALCGVKKSDLARMPEYVNLLGANCVGRELLSKRRKDTGIAVLAKAADIPSTELSARQAELSERLDSIFTLSLGTPGSASEMIKKGPIII
ncbi:MAG: nucleotidyltransferase family protein [Ruminococcaceae bacterium]|nr:nucleotidyltransferase family protein [Oscillospiraceae bacterium]